MPDLSFEVGLFFPLRARVVSEFSEALQRSAARYAHSEEERVKRSYKPVTTEIHMKKLSVCVPSISMRSRCCR